MQSSKPKGPPIDLATTPVQFNSPLQKAADVVIVGAGIMGICAAWELQKLGKSVVVCEKGRVAGEQSSRNWGWVRQTGRDPDELPIMIESISLWKEIARDTCDNNLLFSEQGVLYLANNPEEIKRFEAFAELARSHGLHSQLLSSGEAKKRIPSYNGDILGAVFTGTDGRVEPWGAVPALARACINAGVSITESCAVRTIEQTNGVVSGVVTEHGTIKTENVLVAGGAWSSMLTRQVGIDFPQLSVTSFAVRIDGTPELFSGNVADHGLGICRRLDGGYNIALTDYHDFVVGPDAFAHLMPFSQAAKHSWKDIHFKINAPANYPGGWRTARRWKANDVTPFEHNRILNPATKTKVIERIKERLHERFDDMDAARVSHAWAGYIDTTPDFVPILDETPLSGLYLATGFSGHGFGIGPGVGRVMAKMITDAPVEHDLTRFRFSRFTDGSTLKLGPM
ncbi:MAG: FAD-binding oxidoreductase [Granulosicoccaceae bacterium]